jgi:hypothetical protein
MEAGNLVGIGLEAEPLSAQFQEIGLRYQSVETWLRAITHLLSHVHHEEEGLDLALWNPDLTSGPSPRRRLPNRRKAETKELAVNGTALCATVGFDRTSLEDSRVGDLQMRSMPVVRKVTSQKR